MVVTVRAFTPATATGSNTEICASVYFSSRLGGRIYATGGFAGKFLFNTIEYLDQNNNEWTKFIRRNEHNQSDMISDDRLNDAVIELQAQLFELNELFVNEAAVAATSVNEHAENESSSNIIRMTSALTAQPMLPPMAIMNTKQMTTVKIKITAMAIGTAIAANYESKIKKVQPIIGRKS